MGPAFSVAVSAIATAGRKAAATFSLGKNYAGPGFNSAIAVDQQVSGVGKDGCNSITVVML